ncbi:MAG TPA: glycoside hydrolase family 97 N-terminal domain-containing protein [Bryobacteraceae bacterium]|nr:glycoside hydrolase family 97 N-terminal domain-containing protein [Bryobacteraceae bacterium]
MRAFDGRAAFRCIVPADTKKRVLDATTSFAIPPGSTVWSHGFRGHYEGVHTKKAIADVEAGEWAPPQLDCELPNGTGYGSITEADLAYYAGMELQADGHRGFLARLGNAEPISYPFHPRYPQNEERVKIPASFTETITTPWHVVMADPDLNALVNSDIVPNLCPTHKALFPDGIDTR